MIIYGYRALFEETKKHFPNKERLEKSDYDIILLDIEYDSFYNKIKEDINSIKEIIKNKKYFIKTNKANYDVSIISKKNHITSNHLLYMNSYKNNNKINCPYGNSFVVVKLNYLFELKKSHRFIRKKHKKTMNDFYYILDNFINSDYSESIFYQKRFTETLERANKAASHIKLDQNKKDFFRTKGVTYIYDHDSIHRSISFYKEPIYLRYLKEKETVLCDKEKWEALSNIDKKKAVLEEAYVISIERYLTKKSLKTRKEAFETSLEKICTTLCKGWFRKFAYENYIEIYNMYNENFYDKFLNDLKKGLILPAKDTI